jgi:hypothetical protein
VVIAGGFAKVDREGRELEDEIVRIAQEYDVAILGPNTAGYCIPDLDLYGSFVPQIRKCLEKFVCPAQHLVVCPELSNNMPLVIAVCSKKHQDMRIVLKRVIAVAPVVLKVQKVKRITEEVMATDLSIREDCSRKISSSDIVRRFSVIRLWESETPYSFSKI